MNLLNFMIENSIKLADLRIIKVLQDKKIRKGGIDKEAKVHYYRVGAIIPKLEKLKMIKKDKLKRYTIIRDSEWIKLLTTDPKKLL